MRTLFQKGIVRCAMTSNPTAILSKLKGVQRVQFQQEMQLGSSLTLIYLTRRKKREDVGRGEPTWCAGVPFQHTKTILMWGICVQRGRGRLIPHYHRLTRSDQGRRGVRSVTKKSAQTIPVLIRWIVCTLSRFNQNHVACEYMKRRNSNPALSCGLFQHTTAGSDDEMFSHGNEQETSKLVTTMSLSSQEQKSNIEHNHAKSSTVSRTLSSLLFSCMLVTQLQRARSAHPCHNKYLAHITIYD